MFCIIKLNCDYIAPLVMDSLESARRKIARRSQDAPGEWYAIAEWYGSDELLDSPVGDVLEIWHNGHGVEWAKVGA